MHDTEPPATSPPVGAAETMPPASEVDPTTLGSGGGHATASPGSRPGRRRLPRRPVVVAAAIAALLVVGAWSGTGYHFGEVVEPSVTEAEPLPSGARQRQTLTARLRSRERQLQARLIAAAPRSVFIVIDQTHNRLYLRRQDETLLEAVCSAGSGMVLNEGTGKKRQWVFDTPRGRFEVLSRTANPVWRKPDWAFVEEGEAIPTNPADRLDYGSLGEYALYFGNGYMIHGTLYERLLGRAVSHGCIRVGRDDLRKVWASTRIGTPIYIY